MADQLYELIRDRWSELQPPDPAAYEESVLGAMIWMDREQIQLVTRRLQARDFHYPLHRAFFSGICAESKHMPKGQCVDVCAVRDRLEDPGLRGQFQTLVPGNFATLIRDYLHITPGQADFAVEMVAELAAKRRRFDAAMKAARYACSSFLSLDEVDSKTNAAFRQARGEKVQEPILTRRENPRQIAASSTTPKGDPTREATPPPCHIKAHS